MATAHFITNRFWYVHKWNLDQGNTDYDITTEQPIDFGLVKNESGAVTDLTVLTWRGKGTAPTIAQLKAYRNAINTHKKSIQKSSSSKATIRVNRSPELRVVYKLIRRLYIRSGFTAQDFVADRNSAHNDYVDET
jgi:hypothetical protein